MTPRARRFTIIGALVAVGVFAYFMIGGVKENIVYFLTPTELLAKGPEAVNVPVRLGGMVAANSVEWNADQLDLRFIITDGGRQVPVHASGAPPQMFRAGIGVIVEGRYAQSGTFQATNLMVKHSNEYKPPAKGESPQKMYKTLIQGESK
jgi:cytochrome c-type biogenesis protein CcmE